MALLFESGKESAANLRKSKVTSTIVGVLTPIAMCALVEISTQLLRDQSSPLRPVIRRFRSSGLSE